MRGKLVFAAASICVAVLFAGCGQREYAPVSGKVLYKGEPLKFGSVMFQPEAGQPARGQINEDGTFSLSTNVEGDGARIGKNLVRVSCFASQQPQADGTLTSEPALGKSLIPKHYESPEHSGLVVDVPPEGKTDVVLELKD